LDNLCKEELNNHFWTQATNPSFKLESILKAKSIILESNQTRRHQLCLHQT